MPPWQKRYNEPNVPTLGAWLKCRRLLRTGLNSPAPAQVPPYKNVFVMPTSVQFDQKRYDDLEALYLQDGRDKLDHPMHCLYTGLYQAYLAGIAVEPADTGEV